MDNVSSKNKNASVESQEWSKKSMAANGTFMNDKQHIRLPEREAKHAKMNGQVHPKLVCVKEAKTMDPTELARAVFPKVHTAKVEKNNKVAWGHYQNPIMMAVSADAAPCGQEFCFLTTAPNNLHNNFLEARSDSVMLGQSTRCCTN